MVTRKDGKMGRPTVVTPEVIESLRQAFLIGATNEEAAHYAGIAPSTLYLHIEKHPEFSEEIKGWKNQPILKAKAKVVKDIDKDTNTAKWYLERKKKDEFSTRSELDAVHNIDPVNELLKKFGLDKEEGKGDDRKDDAAVQGSSESNS